MEYKMKKTILFIIPLILFCFIGCQSKDDDFDSVPVPAPVHVSSPIVKKESAFLSNTPYLCGTNHNKTGFFNPKTIVTNALCT